MTPPIQLLPRKIPVEPELQNVQEAVAEADQPHKNNEDHVENEEQVEAEPVVNAHPMTTRSKVGISKPNSRYVMLATKFSPTEPRNIAEAMQHPAWNEAALEEIRRIHLLHMWTLVPRTPDMHVLDSQWLFTTKLNPDGTP